jgi:hypothetical protein
MTMNVIKKTIFALIAVIFTVVLYESHMYFIADVTGLILAIGFELLCLYAAWCILDLIEVPNAYQSIK